MERFSRFTRSESSDEPTTTSNVWADIFSRSDSISSWLQCKHKIQLRNHLWKYKEMDFFEKCTQKKKHLNRQKKMKQRSPWSLCILADDKQNRCGQLERFIVRHSTYAMQCVKCKAQANDWIDRFDEGNLECNGCACIESSQNNMPIWRLIANLLNFGTSHWDQMLSHLFNGFSRINGLHERNRKNIFNLFTKVLERMNLEEGKQYPYL